MLKRLSAVLLSGVLLLSGSTYGSNGPVRQGTTPNSRTTNAFVLPKGAEYVPNRVVLKMLPEHRNGCAETAIAHGLFQKWAAEMGAYNLKKVFPKHQPPTKEKDRYGRKLVDLSLIYRVDFAANLPIETVVNKLIELGITQYAEPEYMYRTCLTPNDPSFANQYHLARIQAPAAWDVSQGDTNVVVGIIDSGVDWDHPDMQANLALNWNDPINGIDDDNDGYVDNFRGWDFCGANFNALADDNNPMVSGNNTTHGSHVSGISSAVTNNGVGTAGVGFNTRFMGLKCSADNDTRAGGQGFILRGYDAIVYAADMGCQVLNLSWGGAGGGGFGQDAITHAVVNKGAVVVAAAGNSNSEADFFPAYFEGVVSVANTNASDTRNGTSNFNYKVTISAPGTNILAPIWNDRYANLTGTSMASPVVAGGAALIKSRYPQYTNVMIAAAMRSSADDIYSINANRNFRGKLGKGRLNLHAAILNGGPALRQTRMLVTDNNNDIFEAGDTLRFRFDLWNQLFASSPTTVVRMRTVSPFMNIIRDSVTVGTIGEGATVSMTTPFEAIITAGAPSDATVAFELVYKDGAYTESEFVTLVINRTYIDVVKNNISTTITSIGRVGYVLDGAARGLGFQYKGTQTLYEAGLMLALTNADTTPNTVRTEGQGYHNHFLSLQNIFPVNPSPLSVYDLENTYNDSRAPIPAGVRITQRTHVWAEPADSNYIIVSLTIRNTRNTPMWNLKAGYYADFDISTNGQTDKANYSAPEKLAYINSVSTPVHFAGIGLLSGLTPQVCLIQNDGAAGSGSPFGVYDGYTNAEKFNSLSNGIQANATGGTAGADMSLAIGYSNINLLPNDSITLGFLFTAGTNLATIVDATGAGGSRWNDIVGLSPNMIDQQAAKIWPQPAAERAFVQHPSLTKFGYQLVDLTGKVLLQSAGTASDLVEINTRNLPRGLYVVRSGNNSIGKLVVE